MAKYFVKTIKKLEKITKLDPQPLMMEYRKILEEDNRYGLDNEIAGDDSRIPPVTYRPRRKGAKWTTPKWTTAKQRRKKKKAVFTGEFAETSYNNLSHDEYLRLAGPALNPRGRMSRLHTNYRTAHGYTGVGTRRRWFVVGAWFDIVDSKGRQFMLAHFNGEHGLKKRDYRGLRQRGRDMIGKATSEWVKRGLR